MTRLGLRVNRCAAVLVAALAIGGCGGSDEDASTAPTTTAAEPAPPPDDSTTTTTAPAPEEDAARPVELYFIAGEQFAPVERPIAPRRAELERATRALLRGPAPTDAEQGVELETQIPGAVSLRRLEVSADGTAAVELSPRFAAGIPAEPRRRTEAQEMALAARLGQLTYTLTQFDGVRSVKVVAGGAPLEPAVERRDYAAPAKGPEREPRARGAKSPATRAIQQRLAQLRYLPRGAVDGVAGYRTQQAVIAFQSWEGLERDGIVGPATTAALARARRPRPGGTGPARRIEVYRDKGVALLVDGDRTKRTVHVSSGAPATPTPAGTYTVFRKELRSWSVPFQVWLPYASYFNQGIAFHEYPDVPAYPASHGCVRVPAPEAKHLYEFARLDTVVVVR